jgi:GT2 family glycosyltransferase
MAEPPLVYVVILNWNLKDDTAECIRSVLDSDYPSLRIVVVDNGSTDGSPQYLASCFPEIQTIVNEENQGFAEGNNIGIRHALRDQADYVFILNNDTVVDRSLLTHLVGAAEGDPLIAVAGPLILYHEARDRIWWLGDREHKLLPMPISIGRGQRDAGQFDRIVPVDYVTGCAMLMRRKALEEVGVFDPRLFWYYEDADLCCRMREAGYRLLAVPKAKMWHKVSMTARTTSAFARYLRARNRVIFYRKHPHGPHVALTHSYLLADAIRVLALDVLRGNLGLVKPLVRGLYDGYRGDTSQLRYYA